MKFRTKSSTNYPIAFLMVSSIDHITGQTGLTPTVTISKNGGAFAPPAGAVTEIGYGWYALAGNATDRNTTGELLIHVESTGADPVDERYMIDYLLTDLWAVMVGGAVADDAANPTQVAYDDENGTERVVHSLTPTTRTKTP